MKPRSTARILTFGLVPLFASGWLYAQQQTMQHSHDHSLAASKKDAPEIFCPTMKTGQLCSHGTAAIFGFTGKKQEEWEALSRKYNKSVDAATLQLFKDAGSLLTPQQLSLLKGWFAIGLNPEINQLLNTKGIATQKPGRETASAR